MNDLEISTLKLIFEITQQKQTLKIFYMSVLQLLKKYDKLVGKVNNIDTSKFVLKAKYDTDKWKLENKIPDTSGLVKKTDYNANITEMQQKLR